MTPGRCKGKAHQPEHLGLAGRRVLVSRKWSNKSLDDHRAERGEFVRQLLQAAGIQPAHSPRDGPYQWERTGPADPDVPPRPVLLLRAVAERQRWQAEYTAAQLAATGPPPGFAARHGAVAINPVREVARIESPARHQPRSLTAEERQQWLSAVQASDKAQAWDLPDLSLMMLATGCRIGECLAIRWEEVDLDRGDDRRLLATGSTNGCRAVAAALD